MQARSCDDDDDDHDDDDDDDHHHDHDYYHDDTNLNRHIFIAMTILFLFSVSLHDVTSAHASGSDNTGDSLICFIKPITQDPTTSPEMQSQPQTSEPQTSFLNPETPIPTPPKETCACGRQRRHWQFFSCRVRALCRWWRR